MILEMCPDFHQAEALNDDVALSSLENEIQGACAKIHMERGLVAFFGGRGMCVFNGWNLGNGMTDDVKEVIIFDLDLGRLLIMWKSQC